MEDLNKAIEILEQFVLTECLAVKQNQKLEEIYLNIQKHAIIQDVQFQQLIAKNQVLERELEARKEIIWNNPTMRKQITQTAFVALDA